MRFDVNMTFRFLRVQSVATVCKRDIGRTCVTEGAPLIRLRTIEISFWCEGPLAG